MAAVGELEEDYQGRVRFTVVPAEETAQRSDEIAEYGFTELKHGLVVFSTDGEAMVKMPGHQFGKDEIEAGIARVLASE